MLTAHGNAKPVELRKLVKPLLKFVRDASLFYQSFTCRLITTYRVTQLSAPARRLQWQLGPFQSARDKVRDVKVDELVRRLCFANVVHMGDLNRYAELHSLEKCHKQYCRAIEHYDVARSVLPFSGLPYNQLAVVAIQQDLWLDAAYYFVRASAALESFATARDNLLLHYRKVLSDRTGQRGTVPDTFVRLCATMMLRPTGEKRAKQSHAFFRDLSQAIFNRQIETVQLTHIAVIAIGTVYIEQARQFGDQAEDKSATFKLIVIQLLHTLLAQVARVVAQLSSPPSEHGRTLPGDPTMRRLLPALVVCVGWLKCNLLESRDVWEPFCTTNRKLAPLVAQLPATMPLTDGALVVDEDLDLRGFAPLDDGDPSRSGSHPGLLPNVHDQNVIRLRRILTDAKRMIPIIERRKARQSFAEESQTQSQSQT